MSHKNSIMVALFVFGTMAFLKPSVVSAFSLSPSTLHIENVYPANPVKKNIAVGLQESIGDVEVFVKKEGDGARFVQLSKEKFIIPAGSKSYNYPVVINASKADPGVYKANLTFIANKKQNNGAVVTMRVGLVEQVDITVTSSVIRDIKLGNITANGFLESKYVMFKMWLSNRGNGVEKINGGKIQLFSKSGGNQILLGEQPLVFSKSFDPFSENNIQFNVQLYQPLVRGDYLAKVFLESNDGYSVAASSVSFSLGGGPKSMQTSSQILKRYFHNLKDIPSTLYDLIKA